jgi:PAS domain-containing protein
MRREGAGGVISRLGIQIVISTTYSDGNVTELIAAHVDVTEHYEAKEELQRAFDEIKRSEDRLRLVIDTIPTLVWRAGPEGTPDFLNQRALDYIAADVFSAFGKTNAHARSCNPACVSYFHW